MLTGKGIYKKDLRAAYNWPDHVPYCSLNNTKLDVDEGTASAHAHDLPDMRIES